MEIFLKVTAVVLIAAILSIVLSRQGADLSLLLTVAVCCMIFTLSAVYLEPVLSFIQRLTELGDLNGGMIKILLKIAGVGVLSRVSCLICADAGNQALGKMLQLATTVTVLYLSLPLLEEMLSIIEITMGKK